MSRSMGEQGSMLPFMAALIFVGLVVTGLALDVALLAATYRETAYAADVGAEAGAAVIRGTPGGELLLDVDGAESTGVTAALGARPRPDRSAVATASDTVICVTVTTVYEPRILGSIGIAPAQVTVEACAEPRAG